MTTSKSDTTPEIQTEEFQTQLMALQEAAAHGDFRGAAQIYQRMSPVIDAFLAGMSSKKSGGE